VIIRFPGPPPDAVSQRYEDCVVQELVVEARITRDRRERIWTPDGQTLLAPLPHEVLPGRHFGPNLIRYLLYQHHRCNVTQPLLLEHLHDLGAGWQTPRRPDRGAAGTAARKPLRLF
jgi:hypothetical protein